MAIMYPSTISAGSPPGETEIFRRLKNDPETADWIVLHSLDIANHISQVSGEADFVVIIPGKGVLCLEVKSHSKISRKDGSWYYGKDSTPETRGPFKQASSAMHSIRNYLIQKRPDFSRIVFWSAVVFPYASGVANTGEWHSWQQIDKARFCAQPLSRVLNSVIDNARNFLATKCAGWFCGESTEPYAEQCKIIAEILRPSFEYFEAPRSRVKRLEEELKIYTDEQIRAIDYMEPNPRVVFTGPAGTGKTLLALEAARRAYNAGRKTLFVCFNNLLGRWLKEQTSVFTPKIKTSTLHSIMLETAGLKHEDYVSSSDHFWHSELPAKAIDVLLENPGYTDCQFEEIIIDEAQDMLKNPYLDFMDLLLRGGLAAGRWRIFGDFEKQNIFNSGHITMEAFLEKRIHLPPVCALRENCRNTPRVAEYAKQLGGLEPFYSRILRPDDRIDPEFHYYRNLTEQKQKVIQFVTCLLQEGFQLKDIILLSTKKDSCAQLLAEDVEWKHRLSPADKSVAGCAGFCTVHTFKGLEAPVIILTDIEHLDSQNRQDIFYIGVTRALQRLAVFVSNSAKKDIDKIML
ncbi:MAG: hypothetical protein CVU71_07280 [Deltaproteobacteria bacterium HGW-Deltaproteobacteria-6]|nr:MAG: hypothetical protein CVU71_07280 [Deltaproteobacteria bacterium HGW-Deltaproteobacteria-6]